LWDELDDLDEIPPCSGPSVEQNAQKRAKSIVIVVLDGTE